MRLDEEGRAEPLLAISWQADSRLQRWEFRLRAGVKFHDGTVLTPTAAVAALGAAGRGWQVSGTKDAVVIESERPVPELPRDLANPALAIVLRGADGVLSGVPAIGAPDSAGAGRDSQEIGSSVPLVSPGVDSGKNGGGPAAPASRGALRYHLCQGVPHCLDDVLGYE